MKMKKYYTYQSHSIGSHYLGGEGGSQSLTQWLEVALEGWLARGSWLLYLKIWFKDFICQHVTKMIKALAPLLNLIWGLSKSSCLGAKERRNISGILNLETSWTVAFYGYILSESRGVLLLFWALIHLQVSTEDVVCVSRHNLIALIHRMVDLIMSHRSSGFWLIRC